MSPEELDLYLTAVEQTRQGQDEDTCVEVSLGKDPIVMHPEDEMGEEWFWVWA